MQGRHSDVAHAPALKSAPPAFKTRPATPLDEFLSRAAEASGCGGVLPQSACMSAFHAAWVSDHGGEGRGAAAGAEGG